MSQLQIFDPIHAKIQVLASGLKNVVVTDMTTAATAQQQHDEGKHFLKEVERIRTEFVKPLNDQVKLANDFAKQLCKDLKDGVSDVNKMLVDWEKKCAAERAKALKEAEDARRAKEEELRVRELKDVTPAAAPAGDGWDDFLGEIKAEPDPGLELKLARERAAVERERAQLAYEHAQTKKKVEAHKVGNTRTVTRFEITDELQVPREFLMVDEYAIRKAVQAGRQEIPGVRVYEDVTVVAGRR